MQKLIRKSIWFNKSLNLCFSTHKVKELKNNCMLIVED